MSGRIFIVMGVSGSGKTTIGKTLSSRLNIPFYDGDDYHPRSNIQKMQNGEPLDDDDRRKWLNTLAEKILEWSSAEGAVLACSALKEKYREQLQNQFESVIEWIFLYETYEVIQERLKERKDHFFRPELLRSQFDTLEIPSYGIQIRVDKSVEKTVNLIMENIKASRIGLVGLGVMGKSLALNMVSKDIPVSVYNRELKGVEEGIAEEFSHKNRSIADIPWFNDLRKFVGSLRKPRNIFLMVKAGGAVDSIIEELKPMLEEDDLIIDGGNSHFKDTARRIAILNQSGILYLGTGISGGEEGALKGPSIMPGGNLEAYRRIGPVLEKIAAKDKNNKACCNFFGPAGAGHFVKMLHNGVEYGEMQLIAEFYHFMRFFLKKPVDEIADIFYEWNEELKCYLLEISVDILRTKEGENLLINNILDAAGQKGTGGWSTQAALDLGVSLDTITAAVLSRNISGKKKERVEAEKVYKDLKKEKYNNNLSEQELFEAFKLVRIINHAIGFELLQKASEDFNWNLDFSEIARVWTNGCIIKSILMEDLVNMFKVEPDKNLLLHKEIVERVSRSYPMLTKTLAVAINISCPLQVSTAAANHLFSFTSAQSSANMIQAQRDYFGAHKYERIDKPAGEFFHTNWKSNN